MTQSLPPQTNIGRVKLAVTNLDQSLAFYRERLGFTLHVQENGSARLGTETDDLLILTGEAARPAPRRTTGLYHFAILVPDRDALARALHHIAETQTPVQGFSDHGVSEAIYLPDPDGNGIEIYRDRPRDEWPLENGQLQMVTEALDVQHLLAQAATSNDWKLPPGTRIGHVHLHVADLQKAEQFYRDVLGFDLMQRYGTAAAFLSAGGYHHHIGINTWAGQGAPAPPSDAAGLRYYEIRLQDSAALNAVTDRLRDAAAEFEKQDKSILLKDPSQNHILLTA